MRDRGIALVAAALGLVAPAWAGAPVAQPAADPAPANAAPAGAAPGDPAPVVITGQRPPMHKCGERDHACIAAVIERIWTENPKEVRQWCLQEDMRHTAERWQMRALMGGTGPDNQTVPDAERQLCDYGRAHKTP